MSQGHKGETGCGSHVTRGTQKDSHWDRICGHGSNWQLWLVTEKSSGKTLTVFTPE